MRYFCLLLAFLSLSLNSKAQDVDELGIMEDENLEDSSGVKSFGGEKDSWRRNEDIVENDTPKVFAMADVVSNYLTPSAIENLMHPEQVFCYKVAPKPKGYSGYTLDGMAILSFCGIVNEDTRNSVIAEFFSSERNISTNVDNCIIKPQIILRFMRGVDSTDILLSSPCYSFTVFYAGNVHTYNLAPISSYVDSLISAFNARPIDFVSPALLGQLLPIGIAQNEEQTKLVEQSKGPIKKWEQQKAEEVKKSSGWNKLRFK